jgi:predicted ATPase
MQVIPLPRLTSDEITQLSQSMLGEVGHDPLLIERLQPETGGNSFFLVEVVRALAEDAGDLRKFGPQHLPQCDLVGGIEQVVQRRLGRVPAWTQNGLAIAAVIGRNLDLHILRLLEPDLPVAAWWQVCADAVVLEVHHGQSYLANEPFKAVDEPIRISLICVKVLAAAADPRAQPMLEQTYWELIERARQIADPQSREDF